MPHRSRHLVVLRPSMMTLDRQWPLLPTRCVWVSALAQAAHDGELGATGAASVAAHMASCARCRRALPLEARFADAIRATLRAAPSTRAPAGARARIRARVNAGVGVRRDLRA